MNLNNNLLKSDLIQRLAEEQDHLSFQDVGDSVRCLMEHMIEALENGERIEIRGFGAFTLRKRKAIRARNPKTGEAVSVPEKYVPHFKPGKALSSKVNY